MGRMDRTGRAALLSLGGGIYLGVIARLANNRLPDWIVAATLVAAWVAIFFAGNRCMEWWYAHSRRGSR